MRKLTNLRRPPICQQGMVIVLGSVVVEPVRELVADDSANAAKVARQPPVCRAGERRREKGRLHDARGDEERVERAVVVGVYRKRSHVPVVPFDRLSQLREICNHLGLHRAQGIVEILTTADSKRGIIGLVGATKRHCQRLGLA